MARIDSPASKNRSACTGIRREAGGGLGRLWEDGPGPSPAARLDGEMGYGVGAFAGVVTPYGGVGLSGGGARGYRLGRGSCAAPPSSWRSKASAVRAAPRVLGMD